METAVTYVSNIARLVAQAVEDAEKAKKDRELDRMVLKNLLNPPDSDEVRREWESLANVEE